MSAQCAVFAAPRHAPHAAARDAGQTSGIASLNSPTLAFCYPTV